MPPKYPHLLSPFKVGNVVFRNRLITSPSGAHFIQGPETYPTEGVITNYANKAKAGAAMVTCTGAAPPHFKFPEGERPKRSMIGHFTGFDIYHPQCQHYISQLAEAIHFYGAKASMQVAGHVPEEYDVSTGIQSIVVVGDSSVPRTGKEIPAELLEGIADQYAVQAAIVQEMGFDMVFLHMGYRLSIMGRFVSPLTNKRTDDFGGSWENMARFPIMIADKIKQRCGRDFLIEATLSGEEPPGGRTLDDTINLIKLFSGHFDMIQMRAGEIDPSHPTGFNLNRTPLLYMADAVKESGVDMVIVTVGGYQDPDVCEDIIASGKADLIAMARSWISNPDYGRLVYEGRKDDIVPCLRCNGCHRSSYADPWTSVCAVNPTWGIEHKIGRLIDPPAIKKKVAVIGGGPAGMKTALVANERGHSVTLYEKSDALGGLLKTTDHASFKWPQRDFKDYLARQIAKSGITVHLNTEATPEMLLGEKYDVVLAAVGSEPIIPPVPGIESANVVYAVDVYGNEDKLADKVVVIGGGEVGVETGMNLAEKGHDVTILEMGDMLAPDAVPIHYYIMFQQAWEKLEKFSYILKARCTDISDGKVTYIDETGVGNTVEAGSVVIAVGMKAKNNLAMDFHKAGDSFYMIGDCDKAGNIQRAIRSAFSTASMV